MIDATRAILARRWPAVLAAVEAAPAPDSVSLRDDVPAPTLQIEGVHLTSARDRLGEARLQARLVPELASEATVYGFALGDLPRVLLDREALRRLVVVLVNPGVVGAACARFEQADWLDDPRVELVLAADEGELRRPFAAAPAALRLAGESGARIRDLVALELATPHLRRAIEAREGLLRSRLQDARERIASDGDVEELFGSRPGETVLVAAAGPTLNDAVARLRELPRRPALFAVDAALGPLLDAGVVPDVVVTIEFNRDGLLPYFERDLAAAREARLVYLPEVHGDVLARWPGRRLAAYGPHPRYARLAAELPRGRLWTSGSVLHPTVDLAVRTGARRVGLLGADFAFVGGRSHAAGSFYAREVETSPASGAWVLSGGGERVPTLPNLRGYLRDLERYVAARPRTSFFNTGLLGARIEGAPFAEEWPHG